MGKSTSPPRRLALVVLSRSDLQTPSKAGMVGDKIEGYASVLKSLGFEVRLLRNVSLGRGLGKTSHTQERLFPFGSLFEIFALGAWVTATSLIQGRFSLARSYSRIKHAAYLRVLSRTGASLILGIGLQEELVGAANALGIPTIELQHGALLHSSSLSYWPNSLVPDFFFAWESFTPVFLDRCRIECVAIGHPEEPLLSSLIGINKKNPRVCVSVQWGAANSVDPFGAIPADLDQEIRELVLRGVDFFIRTHPVFDGKPIARRKFIKWIRTHYGPYEIHSPYQYPLATDIGGSWGHLTSLSSTVFEFTLAGVMTVVSNKEHFEYCQNWLPAAGLRPDLIHNSVRGLLIARGQNINRADAHSRSVAQSKWPERARLAIENALSKRLS